MNSQELRALQEAYNQVYDESYKDLGDKARDKGHQLLNKSKKTATRGSIYSGVKPSNTPEGEKLQNRASNQFAVSAVHNPEKAQAKSAANKEKGEKKKKAFGNRLMRSDKQGIRDNYEYDLYDIILSHLLDEGYAETQEAAEAIMVNMGEEWRESIVEEIEQIDEISNDLVGRAVNKRIAQSGAAHNREMRDRTPETMRNSVRAGEKEASMKIAAARRGERMNKG
jgi:hypothetical protein